MIRFNSDYCEGAHPRVLQALIDTNMVQTNGYGEDPYCESAAELIRKACSAPQAAVHFLVGGTQTNFVVISTALKPYQGVISAETGHINTHETGAVEATGHKILTLPHREGKITAEQVRGLCAGHYADPSVEHTVQPKMVYISNPTEYGSLYSLAELQALREVCDEYGLYLFMDGARLGYGLASKENTLSLESIAQLCDVFYIGGTKVGALFGEAVVITNPALQQDFRYNIKQRGGMLAKGRLLGVQFKALFEDDLYLSISEHAIALAERLRKVFEELNVAFYVNSPTNQLFPILKDEIIAKLSEKYALSYISRLDETTSVIRFCTSWATREEHVEQLIEDLKALLSE